MSAEMRRHGTALVAEAPLRVLILSNHLLIRAGLRKLIEAADRGFVVHEADAGPHVLETVSEIAPDVVLVDVEACDDGQLAPIAAIVHRASTARLLALSCDPSPEARRSLLEIGAMGCVGKEEPAEVFVKAIEKISQGEVWFDRSTLAGLVAGLQAEDARDEPIALTARESEIVECVASGLKNKQVGRRLFISEVTVRHHLTSIYSKLGISNRQQLMLYAFRQGIVPPPDRAAG